MGIFDRAPSSMVDETPSSPASGNQGASDVSSLREEISSGRRPRSDKGQPRAKRRVEVGSGTPSLTQEEVDALFTPENWEGIAALPYETRYVMTGWPGFRLLDEERKRIAQTTAMTAKILLKVDPKYIALAVWATVYLGTWAGKEAAYAKYKAEEAARVAGAS